VSDINWRFTFCGLRTSSRSIKSYRRSTFILTVRLVDCWTLEMKALWLFETSASSYKSSAYHPGTLQSSAKPQWGSQISQLYALLFRVFFWVPVSHYCSVDSCYSKGGSRNTLRCKTKQVTEGGNKNTKDVIHFRVERVILQ